ncbi:hypothetical protein AAHE18_16G180000 [Arachis hypogaea]
MAKHQLNRSDRRSTAINTKLCHQLPPAHDDTDYRTYERDKIARDDSKKFELIFGEMERLHQLEQLADAKALLDITESLVMSVKGHANGGVTPSKFVSHILEEFGGQGGSSTNTEAGSGCCTMNGPISAKAIQRKAVSRRSRKRVRPNELARPEELGGGPREVKADTDKNMLTMFNILRKNSVVKLENFILNRNSFAQIVENLFALSFLVKDGLAKIKVNEAGLQLVVTRNVPHANAIRAGNVAFSHFVFRLDFKDWKLIIDFVGIVEDLMPHRE